MPRVDPEARNDASSAVKNARPVGDARPPAANAMAMETLNHLDRERRSFQFFLEKTAPQLAGDFECAFWESLLLQSVHHEPAIRYVTVALGSLHETFERDVAPFRSGQLAANGTFALHQYLSAMRCLMPTPTSSQPLDVCLISCVLFACFEAMRGHYGPAITHITSGLKILAEIRRNASSTFITSELNRRPYIPMNVLCGLFTRLQGQAAVTEQDIRSDQFNIWPELAIDLDRPVGFDSLADAREMLEIYTYWYRQQDAQRISLMEKLKTQNPEIIADSITNLTRDAVALRDTGLSLLERWSTALDEFLHRRGASLSTRERRGAAILQLRKIDCFVALNAQPLVPELEAENSSSYTWDKFCPFFEQMVVLGESINDIYSSPSSSPSSSISSYPSSSKTFSLDFGIIASMFNVAAHCRDPYIRRRAVSVLRSSTVQEGVWNSVAIAAIAAKWVEIEEEGLKGVTSCADIPAAARLAQFLPVFDVDQPSAQVYFSHSLILDPANVRREVLQW
ncbi:hypothetical protein N7481_010006 [Penicillium waksmanii]|uniref:uncharacterized protein n=1 Tax=Penicillium waksmanii TaxID=69791 RepID=UPI002546E9C3|nr:uncharacterized protein N7481_010006 [Penicillium waksmanii]KAJ5976299.1 hypothetical protein N7481_010006 [Penicillium waksmanii]